MNARARLSISFVILLAAACKAVDDGGPISEWPVGSADPDVPGLEPGVRDAGADHSEEDAGLVGGGAAEFDAGAPIQVADAATAPPCAADAGDAGVEADAGDAGVLAADGGDAALGDRWFWPHHAEWPAPPWRDALPEAGPAAPDASVDPPDGAGEASVLSAPQPPCW